MGSNYIMYPPAKGDTKIRRIATDDGEEEIVVGDDRIEFMQPVRGEENAV